MVSMRRSEATEDRGAATRRDVSTLNGRERVGLQLAARYGMTADRARYGGGMVDGRERVRVFSRTDASLSYELVYDPASDTVQSCSCPARGPCHHIGSARLWIERRKVRSAMAKIEAGAIVARAIVNMSRRGGRE